MISIDQLRPSLKPYDSYPIHYLLDNTSRKFPEKTAIIDEEKSFSYQEIREATLKLGTALTSIGVSKGDRVGILSPNCAEFVISFYGIARIGAIVTTINSGYRELEISHQINDSGCSLLIVHTDLAPTLEKALALSHVKPTIVTLGSKDSDFWNLIDAASPMESEIEIDPDSDLAALPYSSGTTGLSKGVMLSHFNLVSNVQQLVALTGKAKLMHDDMVLVHLPLFHIYGMNVLMNGCIAVGATQVMMGRFNMVDFLDLIQNTRINKLFSVPPVGLGLTQFPTLSDWDISSLELSLFGAAPLSPELQIKISEALKCCVIQGYGMTETSPLTNADFSETGFTKPGSIGPATADTEQKIVDVDDPQLILPADTPGELMIRGPQVMLGYYNNLEATSETLTEDGWIHTGDIASMDSEGYVWILDRKKELIKYKGFQVPPAELEGLLLQHPDITDAAVIGKEDKDSGEIPKAYVVKLPDSTLSGDDVMDFISGKVATYKEIREVEFIDEVPKNPSGKILRRILRDNI